MPNTITVKVARNATVEHLSEVLAKIGRETGCHPCGLLGYEVVFKGDPDPLVEKLGKEVLKGIKDAHVVAFE